MMNSLDNRTIMSMNISYQDSVSQMSYSLVVILELNSVSEVQYKEIMMINNE